MLRNGGGASAEEEDILGKFEWNKNEAVVHWDEKVGLVSVWPVMLR